MGTNGQDIYLQMILDTNYNGSIYMIEKTKKLLLGSRGVVWQLNAKVVC